MNVTAQKDRHRRYNASEKGKARTNQWRRQRTDAGLCVGCAEPAVTELYCAICAEKMRLRVNYGITAADYKRLIEEDTCPSLLPIMSAVMPNTLHERPSRSN